jgi:hypothetical protein
MKKLLAACLGLTLSLLVVNCSSNDSSSSCGACASCPNSTVSAGGDCGCAMKMPISLSAVNGSLWPFGAHGGGHPEGHRGWDFTATSALNISAPAAGVVVKFDDSVKDEDPLGMGVYVKLDCGVVVSFQPMRPDASIQVGTRVTQGQLLGVMSPVFSHCCTVHFDTRVQMEDGSTGTICSSPFLSATDVSQLDAYLAGLSYSEKTARSSNFTCNGGATQAFALPAEDKLCNPATTGALHDALTACLPLTNGVTVW